MRRISACLCAAVLVLTAVLSVSASDDYVFETMLTPNTDEAAVGEVVTVECNVYGITDVNGLIAIDTTIEYDPSVLEYQSTEVLFPEVWTGDNEDLTRAEVGADGKGRVFLSFANDGRPGKGVTEGSITATLRFLVKGGEGTATELRIYSGDSTSALNDLGETVYGRGCAADLPIAADNTVKIIICCASVAVILITALLCMRRRKSNSAKK